MSNCNCIEKLTAAIRDASDMCFRQAGQENTERYRTFTTIADVLGATAARLSEKGRALEQAAEPGVEKPANPARGPCTCNRNYVDDDEHAPDCGTQKPAPASTPAFDVEKMMWKGQAEAWESVVKCCKELGFDIGDGCGSGEELVLRFIRGLARPQNSRWTISEQARAEHLLRYCPFFRGLEETRNEIAAALTAAHAAGRAEGDAAGYARGCPKPRKWPEGFFGPDRYVLRWNPHWTPRYGAYGIVWSGNLVGGEEWCEQPAAPGAKEAGR